MSRSHTFEIGDKVKVVADKPIGISDMLRRLATEPKLEIRDFTSVMPGEREIAGHHQRVKVGVPGESQMTDWISGAWFEPV